MASRILQLAAQLLTNIAKVDEHLESNGLPQPSFHEDGPVTLQLSAEAETARLAALAASLELGDLLRGPNDLLRPTINGTSLEAISKYDIARKVPLHGEISFVELAKACDIYEPDIRRILRFAMAHHRVFREPRKGMVAHSAASRRLLEDESSRAALGLMFEDSVPSFTRTVEAMQKFPEREPNMTGFCLAHDTDKSVFDYMHDHPLKAKRFAGAMTAFATYQGNAPETLVKGYPWPSIGKGTLVDVGGSEGTYSIAIAQACPDLNVIVQDLPEAIQAAKAKKLPTDVAGRVAFMEHDMFKEQTVAADAYLFRWIFHDWPDSYVVKILHQLIPALKPGARVVISEHIAPDPGTCSLLEERKIRALDMVMLSYFNSRERERDDWAAIFTQVDKRLRFVDAWTPEGAALGIIEAEWEP
ncbi:MAG: hypothetical protein Q9219_004697 [cf. Caloplaca sp. 3 TL-2023]